MSSEMPLESDDPIDDIIVNNLDGWIRYDSSRMREEDNGKELGRKSGNRYTDSWIRFDNG